VSYQGSCHEKTGKKRTLKQSLQNTCGVLGGLLFSLPLLYTMVWWAGTTHPLRLLIYVLATFTLLLGYNRYSGLRCDASPAEVAIDQLRRWDWGC